MRVQGLQLPCASRSSAAGQVTGRADSAIRASAVPALSSSAAALCIPAQHAQQAQHQHVCSSKAPPSRRLVVAHANVRHPESAAELLVLQRDQRNRSTNAQWSLLFGHVRLLKEDPLKAPQALKSLMDALDEDDDYITEGRLQELLPLGIDVLEWCQQPHVSGSLDPEKLHLLLEGAACQYRLAAQWLSKKAKKGNKLVEKGRDLLIAVNNLLQAALPSALSGGTVQEVLSCMSALRQMGLPCPAAFQQQLRETVSTDGYLKKCDSEGLLQVVEALQTGAGIETLTVEAVEAVRDATDRLGWEPPSKPGSSKPKRQLRVRGRSASRGRSVSDDDNDDEGSGMEDSGGWVGDTDDVVINRAANSKAQLSASDAAAVAAFFLRLPQRLLGDVRPHWIIKLTFATLERATPNTTTEPVVQLCITMLQSNQFTKKRLVYKQEQVLNVCNALAIVAAKPPGNPFNSPQFPPLLARLVDITAQEPTLEVPRVFMSALADYYNKTALQRVALRNADGSKIPGRGALTSSSGLSVHQAIIVALTAWAQKPTGDVPAWVLAKGQPTRQAAVAAGKTILDKWASQTDDMAQRAPIEEVQALPKLSVYAGPMEPGTLAVLERHLIECRDELSQPFWRVLMPLADTKKYPVDGHLLDVCLPSIDELARDVPLHKLANVLNTLSTAPWIGRSLMRDRLLAAAFRVLPRCQMPSEVRLLVSSAGLLARQPVSESKLTRLTGISYDAMGMVPAPKPEEWAFTVEHLFTQQHRLNDLEDRARIWLLYSLCVELRANLSEDFICSALLPMVTSPDIKQAFKKCTATDITMLLELVQHWGAAPAACDWPLKLVSVAVTAYMDQTASGIAVATALDCLGMLASPQLKVISPARHSSYLPRKMQLWLQQGAAEADSDDEPVATTAAGDVAEPKSQQRPQHSPTRSPSPAHRETTPASSPSSPVDSPATSTADSKTTSEEPATQKLAVAAMQPARRRRSRQKTLSPAANATVPETAAGSTTMDASTTATHEAAAAAVLAAMDSVTATMMLAVANASASDASHPVTESAPSHPLSEETAPYQAPAPSFELVTGTVVLVTKTRAVIEVEGASDMLGQLLPENLTAAQPVEELAKVLSKGQAIKAVVLQRDEQAAKLNLSTREVEPWPGAVLTHPDAVFNAAEQVWAAKQAVLAALAAPPAATAAAVGVSSASEKTPSTPDSNSDSVEGSSSYSSMDPSAVLEALLQPALRQYYFWSMADGEALLQNAAPPKQVTGTASRGTTACESDLSDAGGMEQLQPAVSLNTAGEAVEGAAIQPSPAPRSPSPRPSHHQQAAADSAADSGSLNMPQTVQSEAAHGTAEAAHAVQANMEQHDHPALLAACRSLAMKLSGMLLTKQSMVSLSNSPVLLAKAVHRLHQLGVRPGQQWLKDFEEYTQGFLPQIVEADPIAAARMLWAVQQLGHTPSWLWVYTVVNALQPHVNSIATHSPVELGTLLAALHASLTDSNRPDYTLQQPAQQLTSTTTVSTKRGARGVRGASAGPPTDVLFGTAYSEAALRYFQPSPAATARLASQVAASWLKTADLHRDLLRDTHADVLPMAVQALACMHLPHDQLLYSIVQHRLPVASAYVEKSQTEAAAAAKQGKAKGAGGKAATVAAGVAASKLKMYLPNSVWLLRLCSTISSTPGVLQPADAVHDGLGSYKHSESSQLVLSLMTCVLSWQKTQGEGEAVPVAVRNFTQACMQRLAAEQDPVTGAGLISVEACAQLLDTFKAAGLELPSSLCGAYFKQRLHQQGFMAGAAALEHLFRMGRSLELWEIVAMVEAATTGTDQHDPAAQLSELSHLLQQFLSFTIRREKLPVDKGWQERMQRLQQYLQAIPVDTINSSSLAASSWLSCCVSCVQLQAVRAACTSGQLQELDSDISTVATGCLSTLSDTFQQQQSITAAGTQANLSGGGYKAGNDNRASVQFLHSLLALGSKANQDEQPLRLLSTTAHWGLIDPVPLLASYGTHPRNVAILVDQLLKVLHWQQQQQPTAAQANNKLRGLSKPPAEWVARVLVLAYSQPGVHQTAHVRQLVLALQDLGLLAPKELNTLTSEAEKAFSGKIPGLPTPSNTPIYSMSQLLDILYMKCITTDAPGGEEKQHQVSNVLRSMFLTTVALQSDASWAARAAYTALTFSVWESRKLFKGIGGVLEHWAEHALQQTEQLDTDAAYQELMGFVLQWSRHTLSASTATNSSTEVPGLAAAPAVVQQYCDLRVTQLLDTTTQLAVQQIADMLQLLSAVQYVPPVDVAKLILRLAVQPGLLKQHAQGHEVVKRAVTLTLGTLRPDTEVQQIEAALEDNQTAQLVEDVRSNKLGRGADSQLLQAVLALAVRQDPVRHLVMFPTQPSYCSRAPTDSLQPVLLRLFEFYEETTQGSTNSNKATKAQQMPACSNDNAILQTRCYALMMAMHEGRNVPAASTCMYEAAYIMLFSTYGQREPLNTQQGQLAAAHLLRHWLLESLLWGDMRHLNWVDTEVMAISYARLVPYMTPSQVSQGLELLYINAVRVLQERIGARMLGHTCSVIPFSYQEYVQWTEDFSDADRYERWAMVSSSTCRIACSLAAEVPLDCTAWFMPAEQCGQVAKAVYGALQQPDLPSSAQLHPAGLSASAYTHTSPSIEPLTWDYQFIAARSISLGYLGGGPDIAAANGQYDEVWRWSLLYGLAQHAPHSSTSDMMEDIKMRLIMAARQAMPDDGAAVPLQVVLQWVAPLLASNLVSGRIRLPEGLPIQSWLECADWTDMLTNDRSIHPPVIYQLSNMLTVCPDFLALFRSVCAAKVLPLLHLEAVKREGPDEKDLMAEQVLDALRSNLSKGKVGTDQRQRISGNLGAAANRQDQLIEQAADMEQQQSTDPVNVFSLSDFNDLGVQDPKEMYLIQLAKALGFWRLKPVGMRMPWEKDKQMDDVEHIFKASTIRLLWFWHIFPFFGGTGLRYSDIPANAKGSVLEVMLAGIGTQISIMEGGGAPLQEQEGELLGNSIARVSGVTHQPSFKLMQSMGREAKGQTKRKQHNASGFGF